VYKVRVISVLIPRKLRKQIDEIVKKTHFESRSEFIRDAIISALRKHGVLYKYLDEYVRGVLSEA